MAFRSRRMFIAYDSFEHPLFKYNANVAKTTFLTKVCDIMKSQQGSYRRKKS